MAGFGLSGIGALLTGDSIAGATAEASGGKKAVFGSKPGVADFVPIDIGAEIDKATTANLSNTDRIAALLNKIAPGFTDNIGKMMKAGGSLLSGEIPQDVQDQIRRTDAFQSLSGGFAGSGMSRALTARDFGKTSLDLLGLGAGLTTQGAGLAEKAYSPFTSTFADSANITSANNAGEQANQQFKFNVAAAPDPAAAGTFAIDSAIGMQMLSFGMGAAGGAMGGAGGAAAGRGVSYNGYNVPQGSQWTFDPNTGRYMPIQRAQPAWGG